MLHRLQHIPDLAEILHRHRISDVIISPGSRNAPLVRAFYKRFGNSCKSLVDERSAAYFALGQAIKTQKPTVLICTSGTAALNYGPAVAEAFYQGVPLLLLTADRPPEWIGQQDNQSIQQNNLYGQNIKKSYTLPTDIHSKDELWHAHRIANEACQATLENIPGPVQINVPLREPLYDELPKVSENIQTIFRENTETALNSDSNFLQAWNEATSILLVAGQISPDEKLENTIGEILKDSRTVLVAEPISNLQQLATISTPEITLNSKITYPEIAIPDLVIYFGGQVVSKKIKLFLRGLKDTRFYAIYPGGQLIDTFQNATHIVCANPETILKNLPVKSAEETTFKNFWEQEQVQAEKLRLDYTTGIAWSDLQAFRLISETLPEKATVFAGNSSAVRYLIYFDQKKRKYYSNRGVSGIDGSLSSAAGLASKTSENVYAIIGDLSFGYDSNALWNRDLPPNLKIIVVNNQGGGIFHLLKGPSGSDAFMPFFNAHHPVDFKKISEAFGVEHQQTKSMDEIEPAMQKLISSTNTQVLEIFTPDYGVPQITKDFFTFLNENYGKEMGND